MSSPIESRISSRGPNAATSVHRSCPPTSAANTCTLSRFVFLPTNSIRGPRTGDEARASVTPTMSGRRDIDHSVVPDGSAASASTTVRSMCPMCPPYDAVTTDRPMPRPVISPVRPSTATTFGSSAIHEAAGSGSPALSRNCIVRVSPTRIVAFPGTIVASREVAGRLACTTADPLLPAASIAVTATSLNPSCHGNSQVTADPTSEAERPLHSTLATPETSSTAVAETASTPKLFSRVESIWTTGGVRSMLTTTLASSVLPERSRAVRATRWPLPSASKTKPPGHSSA